MERRAFVKSGCKLCITGMVMMMLSPADVFAGKKNKLFKTQLNEQGQAEIPMALFEETNVQIVRVKELEYDIVLHKEQDENYTALLMKCTHFDNTLYITGEGMRCSLHGSEFDTQGNVLKGPAELPLLKYDTQKTATNILIQIVKQNNHE